MSREELVKAVRKSVHDLRGALSPIFIMSEKLEGEEGEIIRESVQEALDECDRLRDLAEDG